MPSHVYTLSPLSSSFGPMLCASITFCKHMINMQVCRRQLENPPQPASTFILHTHTHSHVLSDPLFQRWMNVCRNSRLNTDSYRGFQISLVIRVFFSLCLCVCLVPNSPRVGGWCRLQVCIVGVMLKEFKESPPNQLVALLPFTQSAGRRAHKTDVPRLEGEKHHVTQPARLWRLHIWSVCARSLAQIRIRNPLNLLAWQLWNRLSTKKETQSDRSSRVTEEVIWFIERCPPPIFSRMIGVKACARTLKMHRGSLWWAN